MADRILTTTDKAGKVTPARLMTATKTYLKQQTVDVHKLSGRAQLAKAAEMLSTILELNQQFEVYSLELRGQIGLKASPVKQDESVEDLKAMKNKNKEIGGR